VKKSQSGVDDRVSRVAIDVDAQNLMNHFVGSDSRRTAMDLNERCHGVEESCWIGLRIVENA